MRISVGQQQPPEMVLDTVLISNSREVITCLCIFAMHHKAGIFKVSQVGIP